MKVNAFIPIKSYSERIKGKNFLPYNGKPLYQHIIQSAVKSNCFDSIYVDTDSDEVLNFSLNIGCKIIKRLPELATNNANGNDLLNHHAELIDSDFYFQLFATSPNLSSNSIKKCVDILINSREHDSILTVKKHYGWFWYKESPVTYQPNILPRSQDVEPIYEETTALYGICKKSLMRYKCRIGESPFFFELPKNECLDIDWPEDLK